jgi:hypothetical protein
MGSQVGEYSRRVGDGSMNSFVGLSGLVRFEAGRAGKRPYILGSGIAHNPINRTNRAPLMQQLFVPGKGSRGSSCNQKYLTDTDTDTDTNIERLRFTKVIVLKELILIHTAYSPCMLYS